MLCRSRGGIIELITIVTSCNSNETKRLKNVFHKHPAKSKYIKFDFLKWENIFTISHKKLMSLTGNDNSETGIIEQLVSELDHLEETGDFLFLPDEHQKSNWYIYKKCIV